MNQAHELSDGNEGKLWFGRHGCDPAALSSNQNHALRGLVHSAGQRKSRDGGSIQQVEWLNLNLVS